jgi:hypothetical protein
VAVAAGVPSVCAGEVKACGYVLACSGGFVSTRHAWQGGLLLAGYGIALAVLGTFLSVRRDVT